MSRIALHCVAGPLGGQSFRLEGGPVFIFGRHARSNFRLTNDPAASQLHFLIDVSDNRIRIIDLGSTNGLVVNDVHYGGRFGQPVTEFLTLHNGDSILAGGSVFKLKVGPDDPSADSMETLSWIATPPEKRQETDLRSEAKTGDEGGKDRTAGHTVSKSMEISGRLPAVDGYVMLGRIGIGGRGAVYKAIKIDTGETAALKMLLAKTIKKPQALEVFNREIQVTKRLNHPNIVRYLGNGMANDIPHLALEYADGGNLDDRIRWNPDRRLGFSEAADLFAQVLSGLAHMHEQSLVHKDVKPKNILLVQEKSGGLTAKLSDMGLTSRMSANATDDFQPFVAEGGTPAYMPPEQITEFTRALPQSDVFSAAATLYQMLSGELIYAFNGKDQATTILDGNIRPILALRPELPGRVAEIIDKALSYYPENRYANAGEMLAAFESAL